MCQFRRFNLRFDEWRELRATFFVTVKALPILVCAVIIARPAAGATPTELIEQYLGDRGLTRLLAVHLESQLETAGGQERIEIAERLAAVYARLIEHAETAETRDELESRSRELLTRIPEADSLELRLTLAQSAYLPVEQSAERWRLRLITRDEAETAAASFRQLANTFAQIAAKSDEVVRALERQEESSRASEGDLLSAALARSRRHRSLAHYFAGWSHLYVAEISDANRQEAAHESARHFGWLLNAPTGKAPVFDRLPTDTLQYDHVARAAIGTALGLARRGALAESLQWIEGLEQATSLADSVRPSLNRARVLALAWNDRWTQIATLLVQGESPDNEASSSQSIAARRTISLDSSTARQLAVLSLESKPHPADEAAVRILADRSISYLLRENDLANIADLGERYSDMLVMLSSWQRPAVLGVLELHRASEEGDHTITAFASSRERTLLAKAAELLDQAIGARSPTDDHGVTATLQGLRAYCEYRVAESAAGLLHAAVLLAEAARGLTSIDPSRAAESLWLAVRATEEGLGRSGSTSELKALRDQLVEEFIQSFPMDDRAGLLLVEKARESHGSSEELVTSLLEVPQDSALYIVARMHAADLLYDRYLGAELDRKEWSARRYLEVAEPLLQLNRRAAFSGDEKAAQWVSAHGRRIARVLLSLPNPNLDQAELVLDSLEALQGIGIALDDATRAEVFYRRAQIALHRGDEAAAKEIAQQLSTLGGEYQLLGARLLYEHALRKLNEAKDTESEAAILARSSELVAVGRRVLQSIASDSADVSESELPTSLYLEVSDACLLLWEKHHTEEHRDLAQLLIRRLLRTYPNQPKFIRSMARLAESTGDLQTALANRRKLAAGESPGTVEWFEARYELLRVLSLVDVERAREALAQHEAIYPDFGPAPWGEQIRALKVRLTGGVGP